MFLRMHKPVLTGMAGLGAAVMALSGCGNGWNGDASAIEMSRLPHNYPMSPVPDEADFDANYYGYQSPRTTHYESRLRLDENDHDRNATRRAPSTARSDRFDETVNRSASTTTQNAEQFISNWPNVSREAARTMIQKYGQPNAASDTMLVWHNNGPWKRTIVHREPVKHNFPMAHEDVLEQTINYNCSAEKFDELARFDGSVFARRTPGELSAMCDKEEMNFLALNLANEICRNNMSPEVARQRYAEAAMAFKNGERPSMTQEFQFNVDSRTTGDPDMPMSGRQGRDHDH